MKSVRLIARLEIKGRNVVKGIRMEGLRVVGRPEDLMDRYFAQGIDEFIFVDIVASLYGRNHLSELVSMASESIFVPLTVGGGVREVEDFHRLLSSGADKVTINTNAVKTPNLISEAATVFGSQCVVVEIQAKKSIRGGSWEPYIENGREHTGQDVVEWAREVEQRGAGEILLTSVDRDGTTQGLDLELISTLTEAVAIPVIACGGTRSADDIIRAVNEANANAVAVSHILHFEKTTVSSLKTDLIDAGLMVRPTAKV